MARQHATTQSAPAFKRAANGRTLLINRAKVGRAIESHTCAVAHLIHAANLIVRDDEFLRHVITRRELNDKTTAYATTGTCRNVVNGINHSNSVRTARASCDDVRKGGKISERLPAKTAEKEPLIFANER